MVIALEKLYRELVNPLKKYALSFTGEIQSAEDIVSETFLKAAEHCIVNDNVPVRAWFYKVARNIAIDRLRKRGRIDNGEIPEIADETRESNPEDYLKHCENIRQLDKCMSRLPDKYKSVLVLREFNGLAYGEIAAVLGISVDNVKVLLFRARQKLRESYRRDNNYEV